MLVVAEHELIEIEKLYARAINIPQEDEDKAKMKKTGADKLMSEQKKVNSDCFKNKLIQWRLLFYFAEFVDIDVQELVKMSKTGKIYL